MRSGGCWDGEKDARPRKISGWRTGVKKVGSFNIFAYVIEKMKGKM